MAQRMLVLLTLAICLVPGRIALAQQDKEAAALASAKAWLAVVDTGHYAQSWDDAAGIFKGAVIKERWVELLETGRKFMGEVVFRKLLKTNYQTCLPGAPDGQYVVIQFETAFTNKKKAVETITPTLDKDGRWRVSGYFIK